MKLEKKRALAARTLNVAEGRIIFNTNRLPEIKAAITRQDMRDLYQSHAIRIAEKLGRKTHKQRKTRRRAGSIKKKVNQGKKQYIIITRKLRSYLLQRKKRGSLKPENYRVLRKEIRTHAFRSLAHFKEREGGLTNA